MAQNYTEERYNPSVPFCGRAALSLNFDGKLLKGQGLKSAFAFPAVSGKPSSSFVNSFTKLSMCPVRSMQPALPGICPPCMKKPPRL